MRELKYLCGCCLGDNGINICTLHLAMFEGLLKDKDYKKNNGWNIDQKTFDKIIHCLNLEEQERKELLE